LFSTVAVLQQAGRSPSNRMLTKYWQHNTGLAQNDYIVCAAASW